MQIVQVKGVGLEVQQIAAPATNSGAALAPIIFLHEGLGSVAMWRDWPGKVCAATGRAGVVYSRRGYGQSEGIPDVRSSGRLQADYMHREALEVLPALLEALQIESPVLLGHSDGGTIALLHAAHVGATACIVMAPHVIVEELSVQSIEQIRGAFETEGLRERLQRFHRDVDVAFWQWNDVWLSQEFRAFDIRPDCRQIKAAVLAMQGADDAYGTLVQIDEIAPTLGNFRKVVLQACGHSPHRDQPGQTIELITEFLAQLP
ncbi:alpha/beta fold hydrolase [Caenimonas sp. SL110]|uniref:alpha/beta fold hydrolase n=1 Tax=Caenimonas sp. SL110 TaxID=1450524 RepID=UPI000654460E|nr:alpha/beta hydrolase [Caenimonas sp. SL110]